MTAARKQPLGGAFWAAWAAGTVSFLGDGCTIGALPLLALSLTSDARVISLVDAALTVGWLLLGLVSGVVADRVNRLNIMWRTDTIRTLLMACLVAAVIGGFLSVPVLLVLAFLLGLAAPFFDNASSAVVPELVDESSLERANSLIQVPLMVGGSLIGPPIGALLFTLSHGAPFVLDAVSFAVAAALVLILARRRSRRPPVEVPTTSIDGLTTVGRMLRDGVTYLVGHRTLCTLAVAVGLVNAVSGGVVAVLVLYVTRVLHLPEQAYGWMIAVYAVGAVLGTLWAAATVRACGARACTIGSLMLFGIAVLIMGAAPVLPAVILALLAAGISAGMWNVVTITYRQRVVPGHLLGRVTSVYRMVAFLGMPAGAAVAGLATHSFGTTRTYLVGGAILVAGALVTAPLLSRMPGRTAAAD